MLRSYRWLIAGALSALPLIVGCDDERLGTGGAGGTGATGATGGTGADGGTGGSGGESTGTPTSTGYYVRIHYRLQDMGDAKSWGVHFWGAGSTSPMWGSPQLFDQTDAFGAYTDVAVTSIDDVADAWLGVLPVRCENGDCKKDIETAVRFADLQKNAQNPNIAECWITQGQAVLTSEPSSSGPAHEITRPGDFIDLGDGSVRMMFRVAPGSTGSVKFGSSAANLDKEVTWTETDDINHDGLILSGLVPGEEVHYQIRSNLKVEGAADPLVDESAVMSLTPVAFAPITATADWAGWGGKGLMYQLIVRTFADGGTPKTVADPAAESGIDTEAKDGVGDLVGLRAMLPYLADLGVDAIWMTPIFEAKSYHGYDTTNFYEIDPAVGTRKDFQDLVADADALGINLVLDLVQNHVADVNPWFVAGSDPKHPEYEKYHNWFVWSDAYSNMLADPHPWDGSAVVWACKNYMCYHEIFSTTMPELNYHNPEVRAEMKKISEFWIKQGADGFRLDASKHIDQFDDDHGTPLDVHGTHVWWKEFNHFVKKGIDLPAGAPAVLLAGENRWDSPAVYGNMVPYGSDMDSQFDFPFRSIIGNFVGGGTGSSADFVGYINKLQADLFNASKGGNPNHFFQRFLSNHDLERPATQFESLGPDTTPILKQAAAIVMTSPGMPCIYYGEELGKKGKRDKYIGNEGWDHDEFIREPMSWFSDISFTGDMTAAWDIDFAKTNEANADLALGAGICKSPNPDYPYIKYMSETEPASWEAQKDDPDSLFSFYKKLVAVRKAHPLLTDLAATRSVAADTADLYEAKITGGGKTISVVLSRSAQMQTVTRPASETDQLTGVSGTSFDLPARGVLVLTTP